MLMEHKSHHEEMKEAADKQNGRVAITIAMLAILMAINVFMADNIAHEALEDLTNAVDHWNWYQAKGIKEYVYTTQADALELQKPESVENATAYQNTIDYYRGKVEEYKVEKLDIQSKAEHYTEMNHLNDMKYIWFSAAIILAEMGILLASVSILMKDRRFWLVSMLIGVAAIAAMGWGIIL